MTETRQQLQQLQHLQRAAPMMLPLGHACHALLPGLDLMQVMCHNAMFAGAVHSPLWQDQLNQEAARSRQSTADKVQQLLTCIGHEHLRVMICLSANRCAKANSLLSKLDTAISLMMSRSPTGLIQSALPG